MKNLLAICLLIFIQLDAAYAQKFHTSTGVTEFNATVSAFEPVQAICNETKVIFNSETNEVAALISMPCFDFNLDLMEEHFNENYIESEQFPNATFKGKIKGFDMALLTDMPLEVVLKGDLTIRNQSKSITTPVTLKKINETLYVNASFSLFPEDFDIEIPKIVFQKIAEEVVVTLDYELNVK